MEISSVGYELVGDGFVGVFIGVKPGLDARFERRNGKLVPAFYFALVRQRRRLCNLQIRSIEILRLVASYFGGSYDFDIIEGFESLVAAAIFEDNFVFAFYERKLHYGVAHIVNFAAVALFYAIGFCGGHRVGLNLFAVYFEVENAVERALFGNPAVNAIYVDAHIDFDFLVGVEFESEAVGPCRCGAHVAAHRNAARKVG